MQKPPDAHSRRQGRIASPSSSMAPATNRTPNSLSPSGMTCTPVRAALLAASHVARFIPAAGPFSPLTESSPRHAAVPPKRTNTSAATSPWTSADPIFPCRRADPVEALPGSPVCSGVRTQERRTGLTSPPAATETRLAAPDQSREQVPTAITPFPAMQAMVVKPGQVTAAEPETPDVRRLDDSSCPEWSPTSAAHGTTRQTHQCDAEIPPAYASRPS